MSVSHVCLSLVRAVHAPDPPASPRSVPSPCRPLVPLHTKHYVRVCVCMCAMCVQVRGPYTKGQGKTKYVRSVTCATLGGMRVCVEVCSVSWLLCCEHSRRRNGFRPRSLQEFPWDCSRSTIHSPLLLLYLSAGRGCCLCWQAGAAASVGCVGRPLSGR